jgi:hypothetical protein
MAVEIRAGALTGSAGLVAYEPEFDEVSSAPLPTGETPVPQALRN